MRGWIANPWGRPRFLVADHLGVHALGDRPGADRGAVLVQRQPLADDLGRVLDPLVRQRPRLGDQRRRASRTRSQQSLKLATLDVIIATPIGVLLALGLARWRGRGSGVSNFIMLFPLVTPEIVMGVSLLLVFTHLFTFVHTGTLAQMLGHVTFSISYVVVIVRGRLFSIGRQYEEAAADLGASPRVALTKVLLPLLTPAIVAGAAIAFAHLDRRLRDLLLALERRRHRHGADRDLRRDARGAAAVDQRHRRDPVADHALVGGRSATSATASSPAASATAGVGHGRRHGRIRHLSRSVGWIDGWPAKSHWSIWSSGSATSPPSTGSTSRCRAASSSRCSGPSGCGKTTTLRMIAGLRAADRGRDPARRRRHGLHAAAQAQRQHRVPELRALPAPERRRQRRVRPAPAEGRQAGAAPAGRPRRSSWCS